MGFSSQEKCWWLLTKVQSSIGGKRVLPTAWFWLFWNVSPPLVSQLIHDLNTSFSLKDLGDFHFFLGIEVLKSADGSTHLSQRKYIKHLPGKAHNSNAKGYTILMISSLKLSKFRVDVLKEPQLYRYVVGALQYVTITRPKISFAVNKACQFM